MECNLNLVVAVIMTTILVMRTVDGKKDVTRCNFCTSKKADDECTLGNKLDLKDADCASGTTHCVKAVFKNGTVVRGCNVENNIFKKKEDPCKDMKNEKDAVKVTGAAGLELSVYCCNSKECNAASTRVPSLVMVGLVAAWRLLA